MTKRDISNKIVVGDLIKKIKGPGLGRLGIVTDISMEDYFSFNAWIRIVYTDLEGDFEWVHRESLAKVADVIPNEK